MKKLSKEEVREARSYFFNKAQKVTTIRKGDKRVHGSRVCAVCGTPLSTVLLSTGKSQAEKDHYHFDFSDLFYIDVCKDIRSCYTVMENLGGEDS